MKERCDGWKALLTSPAAAALSDEERYELQQKHDNIYENMQTLRLLVFANQTFR
jgi:hypothetical protein